MLMLSLEMGGDEATDDKKDFKLSRRPFRVISNTLSQKSWIAWSSGETFSFSFFSGIEGAEGMGLTGVDAGFRLASSAAAEALSSSSV